MKNQSTTTDILKNSTVFNDLLNYSSTLLQCMTMSASKCSPCSCILYSLTLSQSSLHWRNTFWKKLMLQECKGILKQVASNGEIENLWSNISRFQLKTFESLNFEGSHLGSFSSYLPTLKISCVKHDWSKV